MKRVPEQNTKVNHVVVNVKEHEKFPDGQYNLRVVDIGMVTKNGNHEITFFYALRS